MPVSPGCDRNQSLQGEFMSIVNKIEGFVK